MTNNSFHYQNLILNWMEFLLLTQTNSSIANLSPMANLTSPQAIDTLGQYLTTLSKTPDTSSQILTTPPLTPTTLTMIVSTSSNSQWYVASQLDGGTNCFTIQPGVRCYNLNTMCDYTSCTFNDYYQKILAPTNCVSRVTTQLTTNDPSKNLHQSNSNHNSHLVVNEVSNLEY